MDAPELEKAVDSAVKGGLLESTPQEVEELLGRTLQRRVLAGDETPQWAAGTFGPSSLARRFIDFHLNAIRRELCAPDGSGLKPEYARLVAPGATKAGALTTFSAVLTGVLGESVLGTAGASVAVYVALWFLHADLQQLCLECRALEGGS